MIIVDVLGKYCNRFGVPSQCVIPNYIYGDEEKRVLENLGK